MNDTLSLCVGPQGEQGCSARAGAQGLLHCVTVRQRRALCVSGHRTGITWLSDRHTGVFDAILQENVPVRCVMRKEKNPAAEA